MKTHDHSRIDKFTKIIIGFIAQTFEKDTKGKFVCTDQEFIAGDQVDYENLGGDTITLPEYEYQPFEMTLVGTRIIIDRINEVLSSLDVGGEQSRQLASEIEILGKLLKDLGSKPQD